MKKKLFILALFACLLLCACAHAAAGVPAEFEEAFTGSNWDNYTCEMYDEYIYDHPFVIMSDGVRTYLVCLKNTNGTWKVAWYTRGAVRQNGELPTQFTHDDSYYFDISYGDPDTAEGYTTYLYQKINGTWLLNSYAIYKDADNYVAFTCGNDSLRVQAYKNGKRTSNQTVSGVLEREMRYVTVSALPKTLAEAKNKLSNPPVIPSGTLRAQSINFTSGKNYPVYSGPGDHYVRGANGKATVSTSDWIQVFGAENGYIMIQYNISSSKMRIGWITESALPKGASVSDLAFDYADAVLTGTAALTDDPLNSGTALRTLQANQQVKYLGSMGTWAYIEVGGVTPVRGFVSASLVQVGATEKTYTAQRAYASYTATATVTVKKGETVTAQIAAAVPSAWLSTTVSSDVDYLIGYRLYMNNVASVFSTPTGTAGSTVYYSLQSALPSNVTVLGLVPVYSVSGVRPEDALSIAIN